MKAKVKTCSKCGRHFRVGYRLGKLYHGAQDGRIVGAYFGQRLWCASCMPKEARG